MIRIKKGFQGQRLAVYPYYAVGERERPGLRLHSMGAFPNAAHHYVERPLGCEEYVLIWCVAGEGWFATDGKRTEVRKGQFFILPAAIPHAYGAAEGRPWSIYWTHFSGPDAAGVYERLCGLREMDPEAPATELLSLFDDLLSILEGHADADTAACVDMVFPRLMSAFLYPDLWRRTRKAEKGSGYVSLVGKACHYLDEHLSEKLTLGALCAYLGYSESYFTRVFTREVGMAPMAYAMRLKAAKAQRMLENTNLKINQIAPMLGFEDPYYFSKFFSKMTGLSPRAYRKRRAL